MEMEMELTDYRAERNRNLVRALSTGVLARSAGLFLQVISLPLAAAALGPEGFSTYSIIGAVLAWASLSNIGVSQATTLNMSKGFDNKDRAEILSASLLFVSVISLSVVALLLGLFLFTPALDWIFGDHAESVDAIYFPLMFAGGVFVLAQLLSVFEAGQLAVQRQAQTNVALTIGTSVAAIVLYFVSKGSVTVFAVLVSVHLPVIVARLINAVRVYLFFKLKFKSFVSVQVGRIKIILKDGVSFLSGGAVANLLCHPLPIILVGGVYNSLVTASFSAVMSAVIISSSFFGLLMSPFRGSLPEASVRGDLEWIRRMFFFMFVAATLYSLILFVVFFYFGGAVFDFWYQNTVSPHKSILSGAGIYMVVLAIEVVNYNFLASLGYLKLASRWLLVKALVTVVVTWYLVSTESYHLIFWGMTLAGLLFSVFPLSRIVVMSVLLKKRNPPAEVSFL